MNLHLVCNKNKKHTFDSPSLYLAQSCTHVSASRKRCIGLMTIDEDGQKMLGLSKERVAVLSAALILYQIVGLPFKRVTPSASRGKKMVWIGSHDGKKGYYRCAACGDLNATEFSADINGCCSVCEICHKCGIHQFVILEGWSDYQKEMMKS